MVVLVDLDQESDMLDEERMLRPGILLVDEEDRWVAFRSHTGFREAGMGAPQRLEPGLWLSNLDFDDVRAISRLKGSTLRADSWLKIPMARLMAAWGIDGRSIEEAAPLVGTFADRIVRLVQEAVAPQARALKINDPQDIRTQLIRAASLATGIANLNAPALREGGVSDKRVGDHFNRTYQWGVFIKGRKLEEEDQVKLTFSFPKLSYGLAITSGLVPGPGKWQLARREDDVSTQGFVDEIVDMGCPAIFRATCKPGSDFVPEYADAFIAPPGSGSDGARTRFIAEEVITLSEFYDVAIESAVCGPGWVESATGVLLRELEKAAGGPAAARGSWSVAMAAENILSSAFRKHKSGEPQEFGEPIWLAARDRVAMMPAIQAFYDVGAILVSAMQGTITVKCPRDPELLIPVVDTAWEHGLTLPLDEVDGLDALGVSIPTDQSRFGGNDVDYLFATLVHLRKKRALYCLDTVQKAPQAKRAEEFRKAAS